MQLVPLQPGIIALVFGSIIVLTLKDSPEDRGFAPVEVSKPKPEKEGNAVGGNSEEKEVKELSLIENLFQNVLSNPFIWRGCAS
jgi:OPA family sugar phosphate sensor protein UhpC-like MFS transporter